MKNGIIFLFKEVLKIKDLNSVLNSGLKTSKEKQLFGSMVMLHAIDCLNIQLLKSLAQIRQ